MAIAAVVVLAFLVVAAPGMLLVGSGGLALALVLAVPVRILSHYVQRGLAVAVSFLILISLVLVALTVLVPVIAEQLRSLLVSTPSTVEGANGGLRDLMMALADLGLLSGTPEEALNQVEGYVLERLQELAGGLLGGLGGFVSNAFEFGVGLFGTLVVAVYLLLDERKIKAAYLRTMPSRRRQDARQLWEAFGLSLSRYLGGLACVMAIQGILSGLALWLLGVPYAALFGAWVALCAIVPYVGAVVGAIPALIASSLISPAIALSAAISFLAIQTLESNVLTPRIQGRAVNVHPILVLLAVIGGGQMAGVAGAVFAVPVLAVIKVLFDFLHPRLRVRWYETSKEQDAVATVSGMNDDQPSVREQLRGVQK